MTSSPVDPDLAALAHLKQAHDGLREQIGQAIVGQDEVIEQLMIGIFAAGHCILEGVPGLAKTLMVSTLAECLTLKFNRIQFTPDLMPSDITGTDVLQEDRSTGARELRYVKGPIFANIVLADEINRTPPKTQAALLEAMQERQVSAGERCHALPEPFFVLATQNPIEQEGTYPLPEAQLDRFLFKVFVGYPSPAEERRIYQLTTGVQRPKVSSVLDIAEIPAMQELVRKVPVSDHCLDYALSLVRATRPADIGRAREEGAAPSYVREWIAWGGGPRAGQGIVLASKARAALQGRTCVAEEDIRAVAKPVLRHRIVLTYAAQAEGQTPDSIIDRLLEEVPHRAGIQETDGQVAHVFRS